MAFDLEKRLQEERENGIDEETISRIRESFLSIQDQVLQSAFLPEDPEDFARSFVEEFWEGVQPCDLEEKLQEERENGYTEEFLEMVKKAFVESFRPV